jgi:hypothetical protein
MRGKRLRLGMTEEAGCQLDLMQLIRHVLELVLLCRAGGFG